MKRIIAIFSLLLVFQGSQIVFSQPISLDPLASISETITADEVYSYVLEMVEPRYKGRLAGTPEYMEVAQWAADLFQKWGIEPAGDDGSYFQYFSQPYSEVKTPGAFSAFIDGQEIRYRAPEDYYPGSNAANGRIEGELVFVGYGITAPELGYNDYQDIDVNGKIVLIAPGNPYKGSDAEMRTSWGEYSSGRYKIQNALNHGAAGVVYMDKLASPGGPYQEGFIYVHAGQRPLEDIFATTGKKPSEILEAIDQTMTPHSFELNVKVALEADTEYHPDGITANMIGMIPGNDPELKDEVIIMGAHLDGQGYLGLLFPGALDNASGVANVMAAARALSKLNGQLNRSVVFILFGAEETGLVGSEHYCLNPLVPVEQTVVFMNLDMVGNGSGLAVWGAESLPGLHRHFEWANEKLIGRSLRSSPLRVPVGRPRTDGAMFAIHGFRVFHVSTTDRVNQLFYHDPRDVPELLVPEIMRDAAKLIFLGTAQMANDRSFRAADLPAAADFN
jgi:hypothetical protein